MLPLFISLLTEAFTTFQNVSSVYLETLSWKYPCHSHSVVISGSFLVDQESSNEYALKKSTPLMAQSMLVAPFMNGKDFALFLSEKPFICRDLLNILRGLLERPLNNNTMTLIVLLIKSPDVSRNKESTVELVGAIV